MTDNEDDKHWMQKRRAKPRRAQYLVRVSDHTAMEHRMYVICSYINTLLNKLSDLISRSFIRAKFGGGKDQAVLKEFFDLVKSMGLTPREHKMKPEWLDLVMPRQLAKTAGEQLKYI